MADKLGKQIDDLFKLRDGIRALDKELKEMKAAKAEAERAIMLLMDDDEILKASGRAATASISENVVPQVEDWELFYPFIHRGKKFHLLERRPSSTAYREELELRKGKPIPGVRPFTKRTLNLNIINN